MGMSRTITVNTYTQKRVQFQSERSSFSLFISHFELSELCVLYDSHVVHYLHALCHPLAHYTARVWVWLRIDAIAAFTDDWNNLHQTIADSALSKSSPGTGNSFIPSDFDEWIVTGKTLQKMKKKSRLKLRQQHPLDKPCQSRFKFPLTRYSYRSWIVDTFRALKLRSVNLMTEKWSSDYGWIAIVAIYLDLFYSFENRIWYTGNRRAIGTIDPHSDISTTKGAQQPYHHQHHSGGRQRCQRIK